MMTYEVFKAVVKEKFLSYLPEEYRDAEVNIRPVRKVNRTLDALSVLKDDSRMFTSIYMNEMYEQYREYGNLEMILRVAAWKYAQSAELLKERKSEIYMGIENFKENVIMCLINTEQNQELLANIPSRKFQDLSVIYRWVVKNSPDAMESSIVSNGMAEIAGMTEEELFRCAVENTRRINPVSVTCMSSVFGSIPEETILSLEIREKLEMIKRTADNMWIISNSSRINGAASMLYEENLHQLAERLGDDLVILPSSIHEVIAVPAKMAELVQKVNLGSLRLEERLSNSVYHYDRNARKVTLAAESPEKRLDGKQAEMPLIQEEKKTR